MIYFVKTKQSENKSRPLNSNNSLKPKFEEKILQINRVTKVIKGGKKLTFQALVVVGDNIQRVGIGLGRGEDVNIAIEKAIVAAKKDLVLIPLTLNYSIPQTIFSSYGSSIVLLKPARLGSGIIAGGAIRAVLELGGVKNISAKQLGTKNLLNNAKATINALVKLQEQMKNLSNSSIRKLKLYTNK